jgi:hypothetical protein
MSLAGFKTGDEEPQWGFLINFSLTELPLSQALSQKFQPYCHKLQKSVSQAAALEYHPIYAFPSLSTTIYGLRWCAGSDHPLPSTYFELLPRS